MNRTTNCALPPDRFTLKISRVCSIALGFAIFTALGCGERIVTTKVETETKKQDAIEQALAQLEKSRKPDAQAIVADAPRMATQEKEKENKEIVACREFLHSIDTASELRDPKPEPDPKSLQPVANLLQLDQKEIDKLAQREFDLPLDAEYLAECFLLRDAVNALDLSKLPPVRQAELAFAFACRQVYIWDRPLFPAPPGWILEAGRGSGLDRAYVFLELLRQLNLEGCLIGPPELATSVSFTFNPQKNPKPQFAPIRAVGVRVGDEILLFDPWQGEPITLKSEKKEPRPATLAEVRSNPQGLKEWLKESNIPEQEPANWEVFLSVPISSLAPRMEWLQRQMKLSNPVSLYVDAPALLENMRKYAPKAKCQFWNPQLQVNGQSHNDDLSLSRILQFFHRQERAANGQLFAPVEKQFRGAHFPGEFSPNLIVNGLPLKNTSLEKRWVDDMFESGFKPVLLVYGSPRDNLLRGNYDNALKVLVDFKRQNDSIAEEARRETKLEAAIDEWAPLASRVLAASIRADQAGDPEAQAKARAALVNFSRDPLTAKVLLFVQRGAARLLSADASYTLALISQEKAERSNSHLAAGADQHARDHTTKMWQEAASAWRRYLENNLDLQNYFKDRDRHAKKQMERCKAFANKGSNNSK